MGSVICRSLTMLLRFAVLLSLACRAVVPAPAMPVPRIALAGLDDGLLWKFANVELQSGEVHTGQIVGVYNEAKFMWNPTEHSTISVFSCIDASLTFSDFSVQPGADNSIFSVSTLDIASIRLRGNQPPNQVEYRAYLRQHGYTFTEVPVEGEIWISGGWSGYHTWEDGRGNYAWDIGALNNNMMSYSNYGTRNQDFEVWGKSVVLPMAGKVVTVQRDEIDNAPDVNAAVEVEDAADGSEVDLQELPQNMIEVVVGETGNSGTTYVPHMHVVFGFTDHNNRFWSLPIEWANVQHRILLPYPTGYAYGPSHHHNYLFPKKGWLVSK